MKEGLMASKSGGVVGASESTLIVRGEGDSVHLFVTVSAATLTAVQAELEQIAKSRDYMIVFFDGKKGKLYGGSDSDLMPLSVAVSHLKHTRDWAPVHMLDGRPNDPTMKHAGQQRDVRGGTVVQEYTVGVAPHHVTDFVIAPAPHGRDDAVVLRDIYAAFGRVFSDI